jgi:hypothetical protein
MNRFLTRGDHRVLARVVAALLSSSYTLLIIWQTLISYCGLHYVPLISYCGLHYVPVVFGEYIVKLDET